MPAPDRFSLPRAPGSGYVQQTTVLPAVPEPEPPPPSEHYIGIDLGQQQDYSTLAIVTKEYPTPEGWATFAVDELKRWERGTSYPRIVAEVTGIVRRPPLSNPVVAVDVAGVGRAVADLFRLEKMHARLVPFLVHGGRAITEQEDGEIHLPKLELVSRMQALLQSRRLVIADLPLRDTLTKEMENYRVKVTKAGNEQFEAWRESDHDDLVFAVGMAVYLAARGKRTVKAWI